MWWRVLALLVLPGCAQLVGIEPTTKGSPDAAPADAPPPSDAAIGPDARACLEGDARATDPATGACYMFFAAPMTRNAARTACGAVGAQLATIQSATEDTLITSVIGASEAFLGGSDELLEGTFRWDDGTAVQLTRWNTGEPNNAGGAFEEDCIVVLGALGGVWDDRPCAPPPVNTGAYAFVCERR